MVTQLDRVGENKSAAPASSPTPSPERLGFSFSARSSKYAMNDRGSDPVGKVSPPTPPNERNSVVCRKTDRGEGSRRGVPFKEPEMPKQVHHRPVDGEDIMDAEGDASEGPWTLISACPLAGRTRAAAPAAEGPPAISSGSAGILLAVLAAATTAARTTLGKRHRSRAASNAMLFSASPVLALVLATGDVSLCSSANRGRHCQRSGGCGGGGGAPGLDIGVAEAEVGAGAADALGACPPAGHHMDGALMSVGRSHCGGRPPGSSHGGDEGG